jgi:ABC-type bacteriocin/lantibiotic exporter with double-glycine peptidase domain
MSRLGEILQPEGRDLWTVTIFAIGIGILTLATPITVDALVNNVQGGNLDGMLIVIVLSLILLGCLVLAALMRAWQSWVVEYIQRRVFVRVVDDLAYRLPRVSAAALDRAHGPELVNRFFDVLTVQKAGATLLLDGVTVLIQGVIGLALLAVWHPYLLGFNLVLLLSLGFIIWVIGWGAVSAKIGESLAKYAVAGWLEEMVRHPLAFKHPAGQSYALSRADALALSYLNRRQDSFRILYRQIVFGLLLQALASAAMLGLGGYLVIQNALTLGQLVAAELIIAVTVGSFVKLGKSLESFYDLMAAMDKLGHLTDLALERSRGVDEHPGSGPARLEVHNVSYGFPDGHGGVVYGLREVSLTLEPGERVALTGPPGAGKSTLVELLYGLREPSSGAVRLDGVDVRELSLRSLREQVVTVAQAEVFDGTVLDNVRLDREGVTHSDVRAALKAVGLLEAVEALPDGLGTSLATGGAPLSRGQAELLILARAMAGKPRLLILDGILDGLAPEVRREILPALTAPDAPWTLLAVTYHREVKAACGRVITLQAAQPGGHS